MTTAKSTARTTATPISRSVVQEMVLMMPLGPGAGDAPVGVEDDCVVPLVNTAVVAFMKLNTDVVFTTVDTDVVG